MTPDQDQRHPAAEDAPRATGLLVLLTPRETLYRIAIAADTSLTLTDDDGHPVTLAELVAATRPSGPPGCDTAPGSMR